MTLSETEWCEQFLKERKAIQDRYNKQAARREKLKAIILRMWHYASKDGANRRTFIRGKWVSDIDFHINSPTYGNLWRFMRGLRHAN